MNLAHKGIIRYDFDRFFSGLRQNIQFFLFHELVIKAVFCKSANSISTHRGS